MIAPRLENMKQGDLFYVPGKASSSLLIAFGDHLYSAFESLSSLAAEQSELSGT